MLSTVSTSITFVAFYTKTGVGTVPSSAPTVNIERKGSGSAVVSGGTTVAGLNAGVYYYTLASGSDATADSYVAVFHTSDSTMDAQDVPALWVVGTNNAPADVQKVAGTSQTGRDLGNALPAAAPNASGGLITVGTGSGQLNPSGGKIPATLAAADVSGDVPADVEHWAGNVVGVDENGLPNVNVAAISQQTAPADALAANIGNLDIAVSTRGTSTFAGGAVASVTGNVGGSVAGSVGGVTAAVTLTSAYDAAKTAAQAGDAMALTSSERTTLAGVIWSSLTGGMTTVGSVGKKLAAWVLGTDNKAMVSSDSGAVPAVPNSPTDTRLAAMFTGSTPDKFTTPSLSNAPTGGGGGTVTGYAAGQDPATLVLDALASSHNTANTIGNKINSAASAGDPWSTNLPGAYGTGTAGSILAGLGGRAVGALTYTVTVVDTSATPVSGAFVSLTNGVTSLPGTTDVNGVAAFNLGAGTWVLAIFKSGYSFQGTSIVVTGNGNTNAILSPVVSPVNPAPGQIIGWIYTQNPGTVITYRATGVPAGSGFEYDGSQYSSASDAVTGYWQAVFYKGVPYTLQSGDSGPPLAFTAPSSGTSFSIANILGVP